MKTNARTLRAGGFTLIELLVVIAINADWNGTASAD